VGNASDWSYVKPLSRSYTLQGIRVSGLKGLVHPKLNCAV
jgi:hypothetical protein